MRIAASRRNWKTTLATSRPALLLVGLLALAGCGLKGPLYIPPPEPLPEAGAEPDSDEATKDAETPERETDG